MAKSKIEGSAQAWETGRLGRNVKHAMRAPPEIEAAFDPPLGMQMISIRLPKDLIDDFRKLAEIRGVGYQPLMREALRQFVSAEHRRIVTDYGNLKASKAVENATEKKAPARRDEKVA